MQENGADRTFEIVTCNVESEVVLILILIDEKGARLFGTGEALIRLDHGFMASDPPIETISSVLLLASVPDLSPPQFLSPVIVEAATTSHDHLYIVLSSPLFNEGAISHSRSWKDVQRLLTFVYVQAAKVAQDMDKIPMQIDVLLQGLDCALPDQVSECNMVYRVSGG